MTIERLWQDQCSSSTEDIVEDFDIVAQIGRPAYCFWPKFQFQTAQMRVASNTSHELAYSVPDCNLAHFDLDKHENELSQSSVVDFQKWDDVSNPYRDAVQM